MQFSSQERLIPFLRKSVLIIKILDVFTDQSCLSKATCDAPHHCCQNGDQGCEDKCIPDEWINDGEEDCDDGSDEKGMG